MFLRRSKDKIRNQKNKPNETSMSRLALKNTQFGHPSTLLFQCFFFVWIRVGQWLLGEKSSFSSFTYYRVLFRFGKVTLKIIITKVFSQYRNTIDYWLSKIMTTVNNRILNEWMNGDYKWEKKTKGLEVIIIIDYLHQTNHRSETKIEKSKTMF